MKKKAGITYLISGDDNIRPTHEILRNTGRRVRHDNEVDQSAAVELGAGGRYVVVAHGAVNGTVTWFWSRTNSSSRWLWVGMRKPPKGARIYLYSCHAGTALPQHLSRCECFGHADAVPMPETGVDDIVLTYLGIVRK